MYVFFSFQICSQIFVITKTLSIRVYAYLTRGNYFSEKPLHVWMELKRALNAIHVNGTDVGYSSCLSSPPSFCIRLLFFCVLISTLFPCLFSAPPLHAKVFFTEKLFTSFVHFCVLKTISPS